MTEAAQKKASIEPYLIMLEPISKPVPFPQKGGALTLEQIYTQLRPGQAGVWKYDDEKVIKIVQSVQSAPNWKSNQSLVYVYIFCMNRLRKQALLLCSNQAERKGLPSPSQQDIPLDREILDQFECYKTTESEFDERERERTPEKLIVRQPNESESAVRQKLKEEGNSLWNKFTGFFRRKKK